MPLRRRSRRTRLGRLLRLLPVVLLLGAGVAVAIYELGAAGRSERAMVDGYVLAWSRDEFGRMYALLDRASRQELSEGAFAAALQGSGQIATLESITPLRLLPIRGEMAREWVLVHTRVFGTLRELLEIPLRGSGSEARVQFGDSLLFAGLRPGETLSRRDLLGKRGTLLASDGEVLASGSSLSTSIPEVAGEIVGTLGPIPADQSGMYGADGYPPRARVGQDGLEEIFERKLAGRPGGELLAGKRVLARVNPSNGVTVRTTIDPTLELDAINALGNHYAGVTVMDARTGGIEAAAGIAFTALQPPGSTFKIVTSAAALQAHLTTLETEYPVRSSVVISGFKLHNAAGEACGGTLLNAFATSCDTTFAPLGDQIGARRLVAMAERFGFDEPTGIASALTSTIPGPDAIGGPVGLGASAIGQGMVQASTLEMADVAATIADGGRRPLPTMNLRARTRYVRATSPAVAAEIQQMMEAVVEYGTGTAAQIPGITVAGKTGTAELADTAGKKNDAKETDAWFVAYAPVPDPKVVVCALFPNSGYGGDIAAPAVRELLEEALGIT